MYLVFWNRLSIIRFELKPWSHWIGLNGICIICFSFSHEMWFSSLVSVLFHTDLSCFCVLIVWYVCALCCCLIYSLSNGTRLFVLCINLLHPHARYMASSNIDKSKKHYVLPGALGSKRVQVPRMTSEFQVPQFLTLHWLIRKLLLLQQLMQICLILPMKSSWSVVIGLLNSI